LWHVLRHYQFRLDPLFASLKPTDANAEALLRASRLGGSTLDAGDQLWLNRHLLEAAFRQATGNACFRRLNSGLDGVLVSDVGKQIKVQGNRRAGGVIRTALRATDILMDRVWQLETETFHDTQGFVFAPITEMVDPAEDATAVHPEIQRQTANIRTDLDRFSPLEISSLVRHGYCVGRKACSARPDLFGGDIPANAPWDPIPAARGVAPPVPAAAAPPHGAGRPAAPATVEARTLQASTFRRIWSTLLDYRDWVSWIYVPIIIPILIMLPWMVAKSLERSHRLNELIKSLSQGSRDLVKMSELLESDPTPWTGEVPEKVRKLDEIDLKGFQILQDSRIIDLRTWKPAEARNGDSASLAYIYRRLKVFEHSDNTGSKIFRVHLLPTSPRTAVRFPTQRIQPRLRMSNLEGSAADQEECQWEVSYDFRHVPAGQFVDLLMDEHSPGHYLDRGQNGAALAFLVQAETAELTMWILMPRGKEYRNFGIIRHETAKPEKVEAVKMVTEYLADDLTIVAFKLLALKPGYIYAVSWVYK
jgi:hypothetical protein